MSIPSGSKKLVRAVAIAAAGAVIATIGVAYALDQINRYGDVPCNPPAVSQKSIGQADNNDDNKNNKAAALVVGFTTLEEIVENSDAIVIADVDSCVKVHSHPKSKEIRLTDFEVTVTQLIIGGGGGDDDSLLSPGKTLMVQLVTTGEDADYHLMKQGERYVLFLTFNQVTSSYVPVGGPQGRFKVSSDGLVYSLDSIYPDMGFINVKVDGQPLGDFLSDIRSLS
ncbi:MAG TPA: hypothetical protein VJP79_07315 [Nitrososphaera sp.]|nr:hypothetical protein [Nitrososphaera sp.]